MKLDIKPLHIKDAYLLTEHPFQDIRGSFEVFWEDKLLREAGIDFNPVNAHHSYNVSIFTMRGMHYQLEPFGQDKLVSCVSGSIYDVIVDMRVDSPTYLTWQSVKLDAASGMSVYIPKGCAHGFLTMAPHSTMAYLIGGTYIPSAAALVRWDDPKVGIQWPCHADEMIMSDKDRNALFL
jgi:dTDP-4-dehydrorhamnose 3,5-epimerase